MRTSEFYRSSLPTKSHQRCLLFKISHSQGTHHEPSSSSPPPFFSCLFFFFFLVFSTPSGSSETISISIAVRLRCLFFSSTVCSAFSTGAMKASARSARRFSVVSACCGRNQSYVRGIKKRQTRKTYLLFSLLHFLSFPLSCLEEVLSRLQLQIDLHSHISKRT